MKFGFTVTDESYFKGGVQEPWVTEAEIQESFAWGFYRAIPTINQSLLP